MNLIPVTLKPSPSQRTSVQPKKKKNLTVSPKFYFILVTYFCMSLRRAYFWSGFEPGSTVTTLISRKKFLEAGHRVSSPFLEKNNWMENPVFRKLIGKNQFKHSLSSAESKYSLRRSFGLTVCSYPEQEQFSSHSYNSLFQGSFNIILPFVLNFLSRLFPSGFLISC